MELGFLDTILGLVIYLFASLEGWSFIFSLIFVILSIRKSTYAWFFAIIASILYGVVCINYKLYITACLQAFFVASSLYGYRQWKKATIENHDNRIKWHYTNLKATSWLIVISVTLLVFGIFSFIFSNFTKVGDTLYIESFAAAGSITAQYLSAKRCLQNWFFWFVVNTMYVIVNLNQKLYLMAFLYLIFVILSINGYYTWKKNEKMAKV